MGLLVWLGKELGGWNDRCGGGRTSVLFWRESTTLEENWIGAVLEVKTLALLALLHVNDHPSIWMCRYSVNPSKSQSRTKSPQPRQCSPTQSNASPNPKSKRYLPLEKMFRARRSLGLGATGAHDG